VLRALAAEREVPDALAAEAADLPGVRAAAEFIADTGSAGDGEARSRAAVERLAVLAAVAALRRSAPPAVAELFARTRLGGRRGATYGTSDISSDEARALIDRALP